MRYLPYLLAMLMTAAVACSSDNEKSDPDEPDEVKTLTVEGLDSTRWTYISFENGTVVGTSELGNTTDDAAWAKRSDWDIALCGELVRTNGGTSGNGQAAIQPMTNKSFNAIDLAPESGYTVDTEGVVVRR